MDEQKNLNLKAETPANTVSTEGQNKPTTQEACQKGGSFEYTYSAPTEKERTEIEAIRRQYQEQPAAAADKTDKLARLRMLDAKVKNTATIFALVLGIVGTLIFGLGMSMVLEWGLFLWGVIVAVVGCPPIFAAYPVYNITLKKGKKKYGEEILKLSEELLQK